MRNRGDNLQNYNVEETTLSCFSSAVFWIVLISTVFSHASNIMLKILQVKLQEYVNCELPYVQAGFKKGRGIRDQIANIC